VPFNVVLLSSGCGIASSVFVTHQLIRFSVYCALVAVWQSAGFAIVRLHVRSSAWATSHQCLLSLPSLWGR